MASQNLLVSDIAASARSVPSKFILPASDRPNLDEISVGDGIPLVDLQCVNGPNRHDVVEQIGQACQDYGFFQIKNHGIPEEVIDKMLQVSREFFHFPEAERMKTYSDDPMKATRLSTSFNAKTEKISNWRDYLRLQCYPLQDYIHDWPTNPPSFREDVANYCRNARGLALTLLEAISESLGLERDHISKALGSHSQDMVINYYPSCPQPELALGLSGHADPNAITILLQDVPGLQVFKDGKWVAVNPIPYTIAVNIGDQIQALSNDRYKSVLHRAVVNCQKERISIATFYCPSPDAVIRPAPHLITDDDPSHYRSYTYNEYYQKYWDRGLATETCLDMFKIKS